MTKTNTSVSRSGRAKVASSVRIPLTVLASLPEKLRTLSETLKVAAANCDADRETFRKAHDLLRQAFDDANGTANNAVNAFSVLEYELDSTAQQNAYNAAKIAKALTSAIYKAAGNIHNDDNFKSTFRDSATLQATVAALQDTGDDIRAAVRPFGY